MYTSTAERIDFTGAYTVARAGLLKVKLQALNNVLTKTPFDRHKQLQFHEIIRRAPSYTNIYGSEDLYTCTKGLTRPDEIPDVYVRAYTEVLELRHFTNVFRKRWTPFATLPSKRFSATQSRHVITTPYTFVDKANYAKVKPFPFLRLPYELRLQVYDRLIPHLAYIPMLSPKYAKTERSFPQNLGIMRTNKQIHDEVDKHCFDRHVLLLKASRVTKLRTTRNYFTCDNSEDYADRYTSIGNSKVGRQITQLEIQILPTEESREDSLRKSFSMADTVSLRQICSVLPNLESMLFSYPKPDPRSTALIDELWEPVKPHMKGSPYDRNRKVTLEWISNQLWLIPGRPPRILWDLTYFPNE